MLPDCPFVADKYPAEVSASVDYQSGQEHYFLFHQLAASGGHIAVSPGMAPVLLLAQFLCLQDFEHSLIIQGPEFHKHTEYFFLVMTEFNPVFF